MPAAGGTFNMPPPEFPVDVTYSRPAYTTPRETGFVQRRQIVERQVRTWSLVWPHAGDAMRSVIWSLWESSAGGVLDMDYTTTESEAVRVTFAGPPRVVRKSAGNAQIECTLVEVL